MPRVEFKEKATLVNEIVLLEVDKDAKAEKVLDDGTVIYFDNEVDPYKIETAVQNGIVRFFPKKTRSGEMVLKEGDEVYCHHFILEPEDSEIFMAGKSYRQIAYNDIYCIYRGDDNIEMLTKWNLVEPIEDEGLQTSLIKPDEVKKYKKQTGILRFACGGLRELGANPGDKVVFSRHGDYEIMVGDKLYYRMETDDVEAVVGDDLEFIASHNSNK